MGLDPHSDIGARFTNAEQWEWLKEAMEDSGPYDHGVVTYRGQMRLAVRAGRRVLFAYPQVSWGRWTRKIASPRTARTFMKGGLRERTPDYLGTFGGDS